MVIIHQFVPDKNETDKNFNSGIDLMFNNINSVDFFIASHNEFSTIKTVELMKKYGIKEDDEKVGLVNYMEWEIIFLLIWQVKGLMLQKYYRLVQSKI